MALKSFFPQASPDGLQTDSGMALRDFFAALALHGLIACDGTERGPHVDEASARAYEFADAMMQARSCRIREHA